MDLIANAFFHHMVQRREQCGSKNQTMKHNKLNILLGMAFVHRMVKHLLVPPTSSCNEDPSIKQGSQRKVSVSSGTSSQPQCS
jgi:hypothetical protein